MLEEYDGVLMAAHELKAPLAVLRQLAFAFDGAGPYDEHVRAQMISVSERAIRQVNDLTRLRRLEDGLFKMEPVAVREVCDAVFQELLTLYNQNGQKIKVRYSNRRRLVTANRELLFSVVYNFLINALHYSDAGETTEMEVCDYKDKVKVAVRDFGPALPVKVWRDLKAGKLERLTEIAMRPGSSGLVLYIASQFSAYMHAEIGAIRHRDGASFYVNIPISKQASLFQL